MTTNQLHPRMKNYKTLSLSCRVFEPSTTILVNPHAGITMMSIAPGFIKKYCGRGCAEFLLASSHGSKVGVSLLDYVWLLVYVSLIFMLAILEAHLAKELVKSAPSTPEYFLFLDLF